jgi:gamma-glutamyl hercynylcysteine S-oxide synthase
LPATIQRLVYIGSVMIQCFQMPCLLHLSLFFKQIGNRLAIAVSSLLLMTSPLQPTLSDLHPVFLPTSQCLYQWMQHCRQTTLDLFTQVDYNTLSHQAHPDFSPIGWHLGHIAYTESLWILERLAGCAPQFPEYHQLFAADRLPKRDRVNLPTLDVIQAYLNQIRIQVFDYLQIAPLHLQARLWLWLIQHECQHAETIAIVLALQNHPAQKPDFHTVPSPPNPDIALQSPSLFSPDMVFIPPGDCELGNDQLDALDNERPAHRTTLDGYWIDRYPVTCGQYHAFMMAGGYQDPYWWSPEGWHWLQANPVDRPRYWVDHPDWQFHPVCGVNWYEADAYARFVNKRLPTEAEWEKAASWNESLQTRSLHPWQNPIKATNYANLAHHLKQTTPVFAYPAGQSASGCFDLLGNVWEWTNSWFAGYKNFVHYPYPGYSQAYFDQQHRVLKGGSWATQPWAIRTPFRNWYYPHVREVFAGFRCAHSHTSAD